MNILSMTDAVRARLAEVFDQFELEDDNPDAPAGSTKSVTIYDGFAPKVRRGPGGAQEGPEPPFVLVRSDNGSDDDGDGDAQNSMADIDFVIVAKRVADNGYRDVVSIIQKIRTDLLQRRLIDKRYRVELPINWTVQEDDAYPQWYGMVTARINFAQPVELHPAENEVHYGN